MNTQRNIEESCVIIHIQALRRFFFFPKTIEEYSLLEKFTPKMIQEVREFIHFFTGDDAERILCCTNSKDCLYTVAGIIHRIQGEQSVIYNRKDISTRTERILSLQRS